MGTNVYTANQDIRDYLMDHSVTQRMLAEHLGKSQWAINTMLKKELTQNEKEDLIRHIDAIAYENRGTHQEEPEVEAEEAEEAEETESTGEATVSCKFQIGDRVKIPSKSLTIGIVSDVWHSLLQNKLMYAVQTEGGSMGLYREDQLEPAPLPIEYTFEAHIDGNVAVATMIAHQGDKTWIYARGHTHIIHDGEVGMAQAISYASRRMFESLDSKQENKIYVKGDIK